MPRKNREERLAYQKKYNSTHPTIYNDKIKIRMKKYYEDNKDEYYQRRYKLRKNNVKWFIEFKSQLACIKCGENHPSCIDFHHRDRDDKKFNICRAVSQGVSKENILKEIDKCDVLCANCHRKIHWEERMEYLEARDSLDTPLV